MVVPYFRSILPGKIDSLLTVAPSLISSTPTPQPERPYNKNFVYQSNGDTNGLFYYSGTGFGTQPWSNPHDAQTIRCIVSSTATGDRSFLVDRSQDQEFSTANADSSFIGVWLGGFTRLIPTHVLIQHTNAQGNYLRNFNFQGTNQVFAYDSAEGMNNVTWTDLAIFANNRTINSPFAWGLFPIPNIIQEYQYFRILQTDVNSSNNYKIEFQELELYGNGHFLEVEL